MQGRVTFEQCVMEAYDTPGFLDGFRRLTGRTAPRSPIEAMVDEATGKTTQDMRAFLDFVRDAVWLRLPPDVRLGPPS